jgi:predicted neuraminidase
MLSQLKWCGVFKKFAANPIVFFLCLFSSLSAEILEEFVFENPPFASCHASTIAETASGKLLCAYFAGSKEGAKDVGIWLSVRTAEGWSPPRLIANDCDVPCWNPVLFTLPSGEILLFYKIGLSPTSWSGAIKRSLDEGVSWSSIESLPAGIIGPVKNKPLLLKNGTMLCGSSIETWRRWGCWIDITKDQGKTWSKSTPINLKENVMGIIQPTLFFDQKGKLHLLARSYDLGSICSAISEDAGKTWTEAIPTNLPNPNSAIDAVQLHHGQILLVYNHSYTERTPLNIALSDDGGAHWRSSLVLENAAGEYSYPSVIQTKDNRVHITYTFNRTHIKHVVLDQLELAK